MLSDMISEYLDYADKELGCTSKTLYGFKYQFTIFLRHIGDVSVNTITIDVLYEYFRSEESRGLSVNSVNTARRVIKILFKYIEDEKRIHLLFNPSSIRNKKAEPSKVKVATDDDIEKVLEALKDPQDKLIVLVMSQTCMRISELIKLRVEDINECEITTVGKGRKHRLVCITPELASALQKHIHDNSIHSGPVFRHKVSKKTITHEGYTVSGLRNRFIRRLKPYGIYPGFHWYRHGGATQMLRNGADLFFLKEYLGHSDIRTTQLYLHITDTEKRQKFESFYKSPVDITKLLT